VSSNSQRFALLPAGFAAHACKLRLATVRIVAPPGSLPTPASSVSQRFALLPRRVRCPRLQAPSHNGSHCCPPGSLPTPEAATRGGGREAQRGRSPAGGDDDDECILCFVSSWGRRLTPPYPTIPQAACTPTPPAPPSSASLSSGSPLLHIRPGMLDTTTSPQALLPLRRREA
jgi:hypothetical protein